MKKVKKANTPAPKKKTSESAMITPVVGRRFATLEELDEVMVPIKTNKQGK